MGGKGFTSTILQQNCHEFISYESLLDDTKPRLPASPREFRERRDRDRGERGENKDRREDTARSEATSGAARHLSSDAAGRARADRCWSGGRCSRSWDF